MTAARVVPPHDRPLSALLREGSQDEHRAAEDEPFVRALLAGHVDAQGYLDLLLRLVAVYRTLETVGGRLVGDPLAGPIVDPALHRARALDDDVAHWRTAVGRHREPDLDTLVSRTLDRSPATRAYVDRIERSACWGGLYVAHHYTRYLGDLSGGQVMGRALARTFGLDDGAGLRFFSFPAVPRPKPYKDQYRARLDALPLDVTGRSQVLAEVREAFALNAAVFRELSGVLPDPHRGNLRSAT